MEKPAAAAALEDDDADRVGDDVVELARDPGALLRDRGPGALLALAFEDDGALFKQRLA